MDFKLVSPSDVPNSVRVDDAFGTLRTNAHKNVKRYYCGQAAEAPKFGAGPFLGDIRPLRWADILVGYGFFVMQNYLTGVWGLSFTHAAAILNIWGGICLILPVFCRYLVDEFLGHFRMLVLGSVAYSVGVAFLVMSAPPVLANSTGTCKQYESNCIGKPQKVLFYTGLSLIAVGMSGNKVSLTPFLDKHMSDADEKWRKKPITIILAFYTETVVTLTLWTVHFPVPWTIIFWIPAGCTVVATLLFLSGYCSYDTTRDVEGSPFTKLFMVLAVSVTKMHKKPPLHPKYKQEYGRNTSFIGRRLPWCLGKAAIYDPDEPNNCSVADVEQTMLSIRMIPMWITFMICGMVSSIGNTYFVEQANHLNRKIGKWNVPLQLLLLVSKSTSSFSGLAKNILFKKVGHEGTLTWKLRPGNRPAFVVGIAMIVSIICCITAARIEKMRLGVIRRHDLLDKPEDDIPMSAFWLIFQFYLLGGIDYFLKTSMVAFYAQETPNSWEAYHDHLVSGVYGLGYMSSVLSVYVVGQVSERGGSPNWFQFTLNRSRLDKYYWLLAVVSAVNLVIFVVVAVWYYRGRYDVKIEETDGPLRTGEDTRDLELSPVVDFEKLTESSVTHS